ncbi:hypothetical protein [Azospirillum lipoferum]|uniref:Uncharacterized protein n=1 Tax=Azospirillum lipoferum (strain 4B) TaxID=862719 RepID=G7ZAU0_AZOL4|nr:hypothetical protein [Azospirillum lipoferum]CBS89000.1 protein of unknown function [Azospirillum lipoferum 4B]
MSIPSNAPAGANAPALPIVWRKLSEMWSATSAQRAIVDAYELIAFDIPPAGPHPRLIAWELHTGPQFMTGVAGGPADSFEAAKAAAEAEVRRRLNVPTDTPASLALARSTVIPALGLTFVQAEDRITAGLLTSTDHLTVKESDAFSEEIADIAQAIHETAPSTLSDAIVKLRVATGPLGLEGGYGACLIEAVRQATEFLERLHEGTAPRL